MNKGYENNDKVVNKGGYIINKITIPYNSRYFPNGKTLTDTQGKFKGQKCIREGKTINSPTII